MGLFNRNTGNLITSSRSEKVVSATKRLMEAAGRMVGSKAASPERVEQLEKRELLFTMTVTADNVDPNTGLGTVQNFVHYALPLFYDDNTYDPVDPQDKSEDFNDEEFGIIPSGFRLTESDIVVNHNIVPAADVFVGGIPLVDETQERFLRVDMNQIGERIEFSPRAFNQDDEQTARLSADSVQFQLRPDAFSPSDTSGIDTNGVVLELRLRDEVIQTFTGAALRRLFFAPDNPAQANDAVTNANRGVGTIIINRFNPFTGDAIFGAFDTVRVRTTSNFALGDATAFNVDNLVFGLNSARFGAKAALNVFGFTVVLSGPVGASASFTDLRGQPMLANQYLGIPEGGNTSGFDPDDDGQINVNFGIGAIRFSGVDRRTSFTMWGGTWQATQDPQPGADFNAQGGAFTLLADVLGTFDGFEQVGFGYAVDINDTGDAEVVGLPPGAGSVVIGSPWLGDAVGGFAVPGVFEADPSASAQVNFNRADQGVFIPNGQSIGSVNIHGILHGSSQFTGAVDRLSVGYLVGSVNIEGDAGQVYLGSDAGMWVLDPGFGFSNPNVQADPVYRTGGELRVGRTMGDLSIAGRSLLNVTVLGDINSPTTKPPTDTFTYVERETVQGFGAQTDTLQILRTTVFDQNIQAAPAALADGLFGGTSQAIAWGTNLYRNDTISSSEFLNRAGTGVRVRGTLSGASPILGEDRADVYAFVTDGTTEVVIQATTGENVGGQYFRVVDQNGRTLVAAEQERFNEVDRRFVPSVVRFLPEDGAGIYYLVVMDANGSDTGVGEYGYTVVVTGLAPVSLGSYRTGGGSGFSASGAGGDFGQGNTVSVLAGNMGAVRVGVGFGDEAGEDNVSVGLYNTVQTADDSMSFQGGTFVIADGNLFNITAGGDIGSPRNSGSGSVIAINVTGNLGSLHTGVHPEIGQSVNEGDVTDFFLTVGGSVGAMFITGGIGVDQDRDPGDPRAPTGSGMVLRTGTNGGPGDIGILRVGWHWATTGSSITTSNFSTIGAILVSQDAYEDAGDSRVGFYPAPLNINTGFGSDVRFFDVPQMDAENSEDDFVPLIGAGPVELIDDAGGRVLISVAGAEGLGVVGRVRINTVNGSQGNMIGAIEVDNIQGFDLNILSDAPAGSGRIGIGRITIRGATAGSQINIQGTAEVDVYRIDVFGERMDEISNTTVNGDLIAIDAEALDRVRVAGNLGISQVNAWGPRTIAPIIGLQGGPNEEVRGPIGWVADASFIDNDWGGGVYRPVNSDAVGGGDAFLDDLGSPIDGRLAGLVVRTGFVSDIEVGGSVQNVVLQAGGELTGGGGDGTPQFAPGTIVNMRVNSDGVRAPGGFDGIRGTVFANNINTINIGDGISSRGSSPVGVPGIFAQNNITTITTTRSAGLPGEVAGPRTFVGGVIAASNFNVDQTLPEDPDGINAIELPGALFDRAYIGMGQLDKFWTSVNYGEERLTRGDINAFNIAGGTFFRSEIDTVDLRSLNIAGGTFDASFVSATDDIETVIAANYRNSTALGQPSEFLPNTIIAAGNIDQISATEDMTDLRIKASGELRRTIDARDMTRVNIGINNKLTALTARRDIKGSTIETGRLETLSAGRNISSVTVNSAGLIQSLTAANEIRNTTIQSTGPDGAITTIAAPAGISGTVRSNGSIGTITSTLGDVNIDLTTIRRDANVGTVTAGRDLALKGEVQGGVTGLVAGRNVGKRLDPGALVVRGTIASLSAPNGTLYNDIRAGEGITAVTLGSASSKPTSDQVGRGSLIAFRAIGTVAITGDFGGDIISHSGGIGTVTITNGSFLPGRTIAAYSGSIAAVNIVGGSLLGNVYADVDITSLSVTDAAATGTTPAPAVFGDVGVNPNRSQNTVVDARRNELPAGVFAKPGFEGALVQAGRDIVAVTVSGGVYESGFAAGRNIGAITIGGVVANNSDLGQKGSFFTAGDRLGALTARGGINDAYIIAGLTNLGADNRPGGIGANADTVKSGVLGTITAPFTNWVTVVAGVDAGANGVYGDDVLTAFTDEGLDDRSALGRSTLENFAVGPDRNNTQYRFEAYGVGGTSTVPQTPLLPAFGTVAQPPASGGFSGSRSFNVGSANYTFNLTGGGTAYFNTGTRTLTLDGTTAASTLAITSSGGSLEDLNITTTNNASLAALTFNSRLVGGGSVTIDGGVGALSLTQTGAITAGGVTRRPTITIGGDVTTLTGGSISDGFITANSFGTVTLTGDFGTTAANDASLTALTGIGAVAIGGNLRGLISSDREIGAITVGATVNGAFVRAGGSIAGLTSAGAMRQSVISAGFNIGPVSIGGEMFDSAISAGADLGRDGFFDGTGVSADRLRTGSVGAVTIRGNFLESDITAGYLRGNDRFFGTVDDRIASGRGNIASVTITGTQVGSGRFSESYRIASNGTIGNVTIAGQASPGTVGNYGLEARELIPETAQVSDLALSVSANVSTAVVTFNQPMDFNSLFNAVTVSEVRGVSGEVEVRLVRGTDYTLSYDDRNNQLRITFNRSVTQKDLPQLPGEPGAGLYRIEFDQSIVSGRLAGSRIDGDANGLIDSEDNFAGELVVGDAGDKLTPTRVQATDGTFKDFYGPINLNALFDSDLAPDGLPDPNQTFTVRGFIGDHPDHDSNNFRIQGDVDLYRLTLQAGQILRLGSLQGSAVRAQTNVLSLSGGTARGLPVTSFADDAFSIERAFLIETTGDYVIYVGDPTNIDSNVISNPLPSPGTIGDYRFTVTIFDDGDSGFTSTSDAGDGAVIAASPAPIAFAGADGVFGNADDFSTIDVGEFTFTLGLGADGVFNTADDVVTGRNIERLGVASITSQRLGNGRVETTIESAIGPAGAAGTPSVIASDVDVYHLNSRQAIEPGTRVRATVRLSGTGSDLGSQIANLGSRTVVNQTQNYNTFSFGLFETSASQSLDDGVLVFAPTDFLPYAGTPNTISASNDSVTYGYDENGDFFIDFIMPESQFGLGAGTFAFYVQGVVQTDYTLVFSTDGVAAALPEKPRQNFFIETGGGTIDWFQAGGLSTTLAPFNVSSLGFNGSLANGQTIAQYVLDNLVADLNALYQNAGLDVVFSTNPADFEFQRFSTIYLAGNTDPTRSLFDILAAQSTFRIQEIFGQDAFGADLQLSQPFGYAQRSDAFNTDLEDDAVVFVPSFSLLGYTQSQGDVDRFVNSVTAAVARRAGELMGARITQRHTTTPGANQVDPFAANSVELARADMSINNNSRALSLSSATDPNDTVDDTNFFLGRQRALSLLSLGVARR